MSQLRSIQVLRAFAALLVTFGHVEHEASLLPSAARSGFHPILFDLTGAGVDLFFVISGFVMVFASRNLFQQPGAAGQFMSRRLVRIVPLYWMLTTFFLFTMMTSHIVSSATPTSLEVIKSYLFIPYMPHSGTLMQPVYKLGWTLDYEMFFYCVFSLMLGFSRKVAVQIIAGLFLGFAVLGAAASVVTPLPDILAYWTHPIILEFVMGALIASAMLDGFVISPRLGATFLTIGIIGFVVTTLSGLDTHGLWRPLIWGVPAALLVLGTIGMETSIAAMPLAAAAVLLGDASYSLYLIHPFVIRFLRVVVDRSSAAQTFTHWPYVALAMGMAVPIAICLHMFLERPLTGYLARRLKARTVRANKAAATPALQSRSA